MKTQDQKDAARYTITTAPSGAGIVATMTCKGRKTTWDAYGADKATAVRNVLVHLRSALHPFIAVDPAPPAPVAAKPRAALLTINGRVGPGYIDAQGVPRHCA